MNPPDPRASYQRRLDEIGAGARRLDRALTALVWARVGILVGAVAVVYQSCSSRQASAPAVLLPLLFVALSIVIGAAARAQRRTEELRTYLETGLARLDGRWAEVGATGAAFAPARHLFSADLDLLGDRSLFTLLCTARTSEGQATLAAWLHEPAPVAEVRARQEAVAELRDDAGLRERLWQAAGHVSRNVQGATLTAWVLAPARSISRSARVGAALVGVVGGAAAIALVAGFVLPAIVVLLAVAGWAARHKSLVVDVGRRAQHRADELAAMAKMMAIVEGHPFRSPRLLALRSTLASGGVAARARVRQLARLVGWFESRRNPLFGLLSAPVLLGTQLAMAIELWRARHGQAVAGWLAALGDLEALCSLATYAFEHPEQPFPEVVDDDGGPLFEARALAHPLIPPDKRVANDVALSPRAPLLLVTGSNMSGKSTLLRTVGVNTVLALAGAPVCAARLRLSLLRLGATLRTSDSLAEGVSRFFAEIERLRDVLELAGRTRLTMFLLDEILHGTNSQDRSVGARAIVRALVERGAIGLVTTHDLSLAAIADELGPAAANVHFSDRLDDGKLSFDYTLRPGVVPRGNAVALMRLVGLPV